MNPDEVEADLEEGVIDPDEVEDVEPDVWDEGADDER
jgi:hypothetical protein